MIEFIKSLEHGVIPLNCFQYYCTVDEQTVDGLPLANLYERVSQNEFYQFQSD